MEEGASGSVKVEQLEIVVEANVAKAIPALQKVLKQYNALVAAMNGKAPDLGKLEQAVQKPARAAEKAISSSTKGIVKQSELQADAIDKAVKSAISRIEQQAKEANEVTDAIRKSQKWTDVYKFGDAGKSFQELTAAMDAVKEKSDAAAASITNSIDKAAKQSEIQKETIRKLAQEAAKQAQPVEKSWDELFQERPKATAWKDPYAKDVYKVPEKEANDAKSSVDSLADSAKVANHEIADLQHAVERLKARQKELKASGVGLGYEEFDENERKIARFTAELNGYKRTLSKIPEASKGASESISQVSRSAERASSSIGKRLGKAFQDAAKQIKNTGEKVKETGKQIGGFGKKVKAMLTSMLLYRSVALVMSSIREGMQNLVQASGRANEVMSSLSASFLYVKNSVAAAFLPALQALEPVIVSITNALANLFNMIAAVTSRLFGGAAVFTKAKKVQQNYAAGLAGTGSAAKEAKDEIEGLTASFDELNVIGKESGSGGGGGGGGAGALPAEMFETVEIPPAAMAFADRISEWFERVKKAAQPTIEAFGRLKAALEPLKSFTFTALIDFYEHFLKPVGKWVLGEGLPRFIDALTEGLEKVEWERINSALVKLWDALAPFAIHVGEGLLWLWENILVPLGTWTVNEIVPRFLELLAAAIGVLDSVIEAFQPLALWLWESFLQPIASWTGGIAVRILELLTAALNGISAWISENQDLFRAMTITIVAFFAAWKVVTLGEFIINAGGVVAVLGQMAAAFYAATVAKIADKLETAALVALYAKDFVVSLAKNVVELGKTAAAFAANTVAVIANKVAVAASTAAQLAWNIAVAAGTAVATAFGAAVAFLTSPIGIAVAAIAGLIAVIVLLAKHWDAVKEAAGKAWDFVVQKWNAAGEWFNNKVVQPIKNGINKIIDAINFVIGGFNKISIKVPDWAPVAAGKSFGVNIPKVPKLAQGGVLTKPSLVNVAEYAGASRNPEIVAPQSILYDTVVEANAPLVQIIVEMAQMLRGTIEDNRAVVKLGDKEIYSAAKRGGTQYQKATGQPAF